VIKIYPKAKQSFLKWRKDRGWDDNGRCDKNQSWK
jgi:hypothetical protein